MLVPAFTADHLKELSEITQTQKLSRRSLAPSAPFLRITVEFFRDNRLIFAGKERVQVRKFDGKSSAQCSRISRSVRICIFTYFITPPTSPCPASRSKPLLSSFPARLKISSRNHCYHRETPIRNIHHFSNGNRLKQSRSRKAALRQLFMKTNLKQIRGNISGHIPRNLRGKPGEKSCRQII